MTAPLDENDNPSLLSDVVAWQFYQDFMPATVMLWTGRPVLKKAYWVRMGLLTGFTLSMSGLVLYSWTPASYSRLVNLLVGVVGLCILLWSLLVIIGALVLTKKIQNSYYAFDEQQLYVYNNFQHKMETYFLAHLPDFTLQPHKDGTTTLRGATRFSKNSSGNSYKTPVLYCLTNGKAVLDYLQTIQAQAKETAAQAAATPSWLPRD